MRFPAAGDQFSEHGPARRLLEVQDDGLPVAAVDRPVEVVGAFAAARSVVPYPSETKDLIVSLGGCHDRGKKSDCNIFVAHNAPWHDITDDLPVFEEGPAAVRATGVRTNP